MIWLLSRKQWPTNQCRLDASLYEMGVMFPYMSAIVWWSFQDKLCALISSLVYTPCKRFSRSFFMVQVSAPYNRILSTEARNNASLVTLEILDFHIMIPLHYLWAKSNNRIRVNLKITWLWFFCFDFFR